MPRHLIIGLILALFMVLAPELECARISGEEGIFISTDRDDKTIITSQDIIEKTYSESRDSREGLVYKINADSSILTIQDLSARPPQRLYIQPETVFSGCGSLLDLNLNDMVYVIYHHDLSGQPVVECVYLVARENEGNPYASSGKKKEEYISRLINSLRVPEEYIRAYAAYSLGNFNDPVIVPELTYALRHDASSLVRINAAKSLAKLKDPSSAPDLVAALYIDDKIESYQINRALVAIGKLAVEPLIEGLYETNKNIRRGAAQALGDIEIDSMSGSGNYISGAFEPLVNTLNDASILVREAAYEALKAITGQDFEKNPDAWRVWFNERQAQ